MQEQYPKLCRKNREGVRVGRTGKAREYSWEHMQNMTFYSILTFMCTKWLVVYAQTFHICIWPCYIWYTLPPIYFQYAELICVCAHV